MNKRHSFAGRAVLGLALAVVLSAPAPAQEPAASGLLPRVDGWEASEPPQTFLPDTLFEYINGASENFLSYGFVELALGRFQSAGGVEMTVEIYDMGASDNAFGVYGSERYPDSRFLPVGGQGYLEEGSLNFFAGRFYVKLLSYPAGEGTEEALRSFAAAVLKGIPDPGDFPLPVRAFPKSGLVENSEKFILRDFLGMSFLSRGFVAAYRTAGGEEFEALIIEADDPAEAGEMRSALIGRLSGAGGASPEADGLVRLKDPYLANILIAPAGRFLCGAMKIRDGAAEAEKAAEAVVKEMVRALAGK